MIDFLKQRLKNKRVLILGFGREGQSTYKLLNLSIPELFVGVADSNTDVGKSALLKEIEPEQLHLGENYLEAIDSYDFIIKSPGVNLGEFAKLHNTEISSQTNLFIEHFHEQIIGVSGTKGKSTTSSLIHFLLEQNGYKSVLLGNIGSPAFDSISKIDDETRIVFELSAHQLEYVNYSPKIAVLLNIFPEHLDYFQDFEKYKNAKLNICKFQTSEDVLISSSELSNEIKTLSGKLCFGFEDNCDASSGEERLVFKKRTGEMQVLNTNEIALRGRHNHLNTMAAVLAVKEAGLGFERSLPFIGAFSGLPHRLEYVGEFVGIKFYNDSISTIPQSAIEAVKALDSVDTLILGGFDRGLDYSELIGFLRASPLRNLIFLGKAGNVMLGLLKETKISSKLIELNDLCEAFKIIPQITAKGGVCLLSPAAASYDQFKNFEHRGDLFKKLARELGK